MRRYEIEEEYVLEEHCICLCCYERTGKWLVRDMKEDVDDLTFDTEQEANTWIILKEIEENVTCEVCGYAPHCVCDLPFAQKYL
jgi:hypothetical protein